MFDILKTIIKKLFANESSNMKQSINHCIGNNNVIQQNVTGDNCVIAGRDYNSVDSADSIEIINNCIYINKKLINKVDDKYTIEVHVNNVSNIITDLNVTCHGDVGNIKAQGNVYCNDVNGNVTAGKSVKCTDINGSVICGENINCN